MSALRLTEFRRLARKGTHVALTQVIPCDLETPVSCFLKLAGASKRAFLLESAEQGEKIGRYSFIGFDPSSVLLSENGQVSELCGNSRIRHKNTPFIRLLESRTCSLALANPESLPEFCGGWVGYFSYENVADFETVRLTPKKGPAAPDAVFFCTRELAIFDHFRKTLTLAVIVDVRERVPLGYHNARRRLARMQQRLQSPLRALGAAKRKAAGAAFQPNISRDKFIRSVQKIKRYVRAGDCIQVVFSQRLSMPSMGESGFEIYRALRSINPSPHMFYFRYDALRLIGSSPELLVKKQGKTAEVRPIAGTRPRGTSAREDLKYENQLKQSKKEMAEHLMLVDLGRNDLGRVCRFESVKVTDFAKIERFSHVMHLVSQVAGELQPGKNAFDLLRAAFPAGTVTGAPKIRAMQIIDELEPEKRGPYAGCLGYFSFTQNMEMCLTIRTLVDDGRCLYVQAGAGVVQDSSPAKEYQETLNKAQALRHAVTNRGQFVCCS